MVPDAGLAERAAAALSPLERKVLVLSARHRLRAAEIAARLGTSERQVERLLARALRNFDRGLHRPRRRRWRDIFLLLPGWWLRRL